MFSTPSISCPTVCTALAVLRRISFVRALADFFPPFIIADETAATAAPAAVPYTLKIKSGSWTATEVQITAGYMNILDTAWPRFRYTLPVFPGLRYIS